MATDPNGIDELIDAALDGPGLEALRTNILRGPSGGSFGHASEVGLVFLALVNEQNPRYNDVDLNAPDGSDDTIREVGARTAFTRWEIAAERRLAARGNAQPLDPADVRADMIAELKAQLQDLNGGAEITASASAKIDELFPAGGDAQTFADAIVSNADLYAQKVAEHRAAQRAAREADPNARVEAMPFVGIMAALMHSEDGEPASTLNVADTSGVGISAAEQDSLNMQNAYEGLTFFMQAGGGAEKGLAQIAGVRWGAYTGDDFSEKALSYEGINPMEGLGNQGTGEQYLRAVEAFVSPEGLGAIRGHEYYQKYQLTGEHDGAGAGAVNLQNLVITPMEVNGLVAFSSDEARQDFIVEMGGGMMRRLSADLMQERMETFAAGRSDITLANEVDPSAGVSAADIAADAGAEVLAEVEAEAGVEPNDVVASVDEAALDARLEREQLVASVEVANAYPIADNVVNFDAVQAEGDMRMSTVPDVVAGLNQQGQTPMPEMGYGVGQDSVAPAANSTNSPFPDMDMGMEPRRA